MGINNNAKHVFSRAWPFIANYINHTQYGRSDIGRIEITKVDKIFTDEEQEYRREQILKEKDTVD